GTALAFDDTEGHRGFGVAAAAGLGTACLHPQRALVGVDVEETHRAGVGGADRPHLDLDVSLVGVAVPAVERRTGNAGHDPFDVVDRGEDLLGGGLDERALLQDHARLLSSAGLSADRPHTAPQASLRSSAHAPMASTMV